MKKVYGVGINDAVYVINPTIDGKTHTCPFYRRWAGMLIRTVDSANENTDPTYVGCKLSPEWEYFSNFKAWMEKQNWKGMQLDKDILGNGKLYSSRTCCFVPQWLNLLFTDHGRARGKWPIGVYVQQGRFKSQISVNSKMKALGAFTTPEEAHQAYKIAKREYVIIKMKDYPDQRVKEAILRKVAL